MVVLCAGRSRHVELLVAFVTVEHLSPSAISTISTCGLQFQYRYVDKLPSGPDSIEQKVGWAVHGALEEFYLHDVYKRTIVNLTTLSTIHAAKWELNPLAIDDLARRIFEIENPESICVEATECRLHSKRLGLLGVIDRIDRTPEGLEIIDYKTGKVPKSPDRQHQKLKQGLYYALLVREVLGETPVKIKFYYLVDGTVLSTTPHDAQLDALEQSIRHNWEFVNQGQYKSRISPLCGWCPYQALCPAFGGSELTKEEG